MDLLLRRQEHDETRDVFILGSVQTWLQEPSQVYYRQIYGKISVSMIFLLMLSIQKVFNDPYHIVLIITSSSWNVSIRVPWSPLSPGFLLTNRNPQVVEISIKWHLWQIRLR